MEIRVAELEALVDSLRVDKRIEFEELKDKLLRVQTEMETDTEYLWKQIEEVKITMK